MIAKCKLNDVFKVACVHRACMYDSILGICRNRLRQIAVEYV